MPYHVTWALERAEPPPDSPRFFQLKRIDQVPALVERIVG